jgi:putative SOS response-associated peptidase YedK
MCGRITIKIDSNDFWAFCQAIELEEVGIFHKDWFSQNDLEAKPFYPTDTLPVIIQNNHTRKVASMYWGLLPHWAKKDVIFYKTKTDRLVFKWKSTPKAHFNMRADTINGAQKWTDLSESHRCLIPVSNYIEWQDKDMLPPKHKPLAKKFAVKNQNYFYLAGIWDKVSIENIGDFYSVAIVTTTPNNLMASLPHHRMPVIIHDNDANSWLSGKKDNFFKPFEDMLMTEGPYLEPGDLFLKEPDLFSEF